MIVENMRMRKGSKVSKAVSIFSFLNIKRTNRYSIHVFLFFWFWCTSGVIKKYSNFVGNPILLNNVKVNEIQALWTMDAKDITQDQYDEFYRYISNSYMKPRFTLHYKVSQRK